MMRNINIYLMDKYFLWPSLRTFFTSRREKRFFKRVLSIGKIFFKATSFESYLSIFEKSFSTIGKNFCKKKDF